MFRLLSVIIAFLIICTSGAASFARENTNVKATESDKYTRLFFYCKQPVKFSTSLNGDKLKVSFGRDVEIDTGTLQSVSGDISNATFNEQNNTATITLASDSYTIRKFVGEDFIGVDVIKPENTASKEPTPNAEENISSNEEIPQEAFIEPAAGRPRDVVEVNNFTQDTPKTQDAKNDASPEIVSKKEVKLIERPTKKNIEDKKIANNFIPTPKLRPVQVFTQTAAIPAEPTQAVEKAKIPELKVVAQAEPKTSENTTAENVTATPVIKPETPVNDKEKLLPEKSTVATETPKAETANTKPAPSTIENSQNQIIEDKKSAAVNPSAKPEETPQTVESKAAQASSDDSEDDEDVQNIETPSVVIPIAEKVKDKILSKIIFEWDEPVAASIFKRAGYLWLIFDKSKDINIKNFLVKNAEYFESGSQMPNRSYTILRLKLINDINTVAYKEENNWILGITKDKIAPEKSSKIDTNFNKLTGSRILLDNDSPLQPLRLIDAEVGDEIVILPYLEESSGIKEKYKYVDFAFLETTQGGVIQIISDNVDLTVLDTGIAIAGPANVIDNQAQSALKELKEKEEAARLGAEGLKQQGAELTALKFNTWMLGGNKAFKKDLKELEWKIAEVDWSEKSKYRLALARFYLAHGMDAEALGVINILREYDEKLGKENDVKIIEATALYMMGRYKDSVNVYDTINLESLTAQNKNEILFWRTAADINVNNLVKLDKFITKNPLKKEDEDEGGGDKVENTKLMHETSMRLLKMIRKMDPDFINSDELQKLDATARFVTDHYQEAIHRFEETDLFSSGDIFQAEDNKLWWSTQESKRADSAELLLLPNIDDFLKNYPSNFFNDFALLAIEEALKKNDLTKAEEIMAILKPEDRAVQKNSIEFFRGLYYAKNEETDKAVETWSKLTKEISDPYNRTRAQFAMTVFQLDKKQIDVKQAIANLNSVRAVWRGGQLEFHILTLLGEFYIDSQQPMDGFRVWREAIAAFPGSDESLLIAKKMSENFIKIFSQGSVDKMPQIDAITLYYEFRELTPIGKLGDEMITKLVDRLIDVDLLDRASALLTHQVRFRLVGEERDMASTKLIKIHLINHDPQKALDVLDATENTNMKDEVLQERKYMRAQALLDLGKSNKVLTLLNEDYTKNAAFLRADVYWHNNVWRKVIDELEVPFREIRRDERKLNLEETNQLIRLAVAYALIDRQKRLQILYEDFSDLIVDQPKKNLLTFIATNKGPVDYKNLERTVEYKDMENFLNTYMKAPATDMKAPAEQSQAQPAEPGKG